MSNSISSANKKKIKPVYFVYALIFLLGSYFIIQFTGYQEIYPKEDVVTVFNYTVEGITTNPFTLFTPNAAAWGGTYEGICGANPNGAGTLERTAESEAIKPERGRCVWCV